MQILNEAQQAFLTNPFYSALTTVQTGFGQEVGGAVRYRPEVLPFAAVANRNVVVDAARLRCDTDAIFVGVLPQMEGDVADALRFVCLQMARQPPGDFVAPDPLPNECELGTAEAHEMVELTDVAFPGFYRRESYQLGRFVGIRVDGQLVAMAGHRTRMPGLREISAVCTRPGHTGKGYAQHLMRRLLAEDDGALPYLHTINTNERAISIYRSLGFVTTGEVEIVKLPQRV